MYPTPAVTAFIDEQFIPVRVHVKEQPRTWKRFGIRWTPTVMLLAPNGDEVRRLEGFLPADELLGEFRLMLGYEAANRKDWAAAERWFAEAAEMRETAAGPEGLYWRGVARYSATGDAEILKQLRRDLEAQYPNSVWAKRGVVWGN